MNCSAPPPLTDEEIELAIAGAANLAILDHLKQCPGCSQRLDEARKFDQLLVKKLYRWDCPDAQHLTDYHMKRLTQPEEQLLVEHIETCVRCQEEIAELSAFLKDDSEPAQERTRYEPRYTPRPGEQIAYIVMDLPATGFRGKPVGPITARVDESTMVFLELQASDTELMLVGQVVADDLDQWSGGLLQVFQSGALQATAKLGEMADFRCALKDTNPIDLRITAENRQCIVVRNVKLEG